MSEVPVYGDLAHRFGDVASGDGTDGSDAGGLVAMAVLAALAGGALLILARRHRAA